MNLSEALYSKKKNLVDKLLGEELTLNIYHKFLVTHPYSIGRYGRNDKQICLKKLDLSLRNLLENFEEERDYLLKES